MQYNSYSMIHMEYHVDRNNISLAQADDERVSRFHDFFGIIKGVWNDSRLINSSSSDHGP